MHNCISCNKKINTILNLSCKHQICLTCLVKLNTIKCPNCHTNLIN